MAKFKSGKFKSLSVAEQEATFETRVPSADHFTPSKEKRSRSGLITECPKCFCGPMMRDEELIWRCYRCGASYCIVDRSVRPYLDEKFSDAFDRTELGIIDESMRRKFTERLKELSECFRLFAERGISPTPPPIFTAEDDASDFPVQFRVVEKPSKTRTPCECPLCKGTEISRDDSYVFHCRCGLKFYYTDYRADFYAAFNYSELMAYEHHYHSLAKQFDIGYTAIFPM